MSLLMNLSLATTTTHALGNTPTVLSKHIYWDILSDFDKTSTFKIKDNIVVRKVATKYTLISFN